AAVGLGGLNPRLRDLTFANATLRFGRALVSTAAPSESAALDPNYIAAVRDASVAALRTAIQSGHSERDLPLLYQLLRQAALIEYNRVGIELAMPSGVTSDLDRREVELFHITPVAASNSRKSCWERFAQPVSGLTSGAALGDWLLTKGTSDAPRAP